MKSFKQLIESSDQVSMTREDFVKEHEHLCALLKQVVNAISDPELKQQVQKEYDDQNSELQQQKAK
jgi:hypothetical protein